MGISDRHVLTTCGIVLPCIGVREQKSAISAKRAALLLEFARSAREVIAMIRLIFLCMMLTIGMPAAMAQTLISYQGLLEQNGQPYTGTADLEFRLFSLPTGGSPVASAQTLTEVSVMGGLFEVELDFPASAFEGGSTRYIEVSVDDVVLSPRQAVTPTPLALRALGSATPKNLQCLTREAFAVAAPGNTRLVSATCDAGYSMTGGGCFWRSSINYGPIQAQYPAIGVEQSYSCRGTNNDSSDRDLFSRVRCCRIPQG